MKTIRAFIANAALLLAALPAQAEHGSDTLKKIMESGVITFGVRSGSVPFSYMNGDKAIGYSIDLCQKVADRVKSELGMQKLQVKQLEVTSATRLPLLAAGATDIDCGSTTNTAERAKSVAFSLTTFITGTAVLVKRSSGVKSLADIKGKSVGLTAGSTSIAKLTELSRSQDLRLSFSNGKDHAETMSLLESDRVVGFAEDDILLASFAATAKSPDSFIMIAIDVIPSEPYGLAVRRGDASFKKLVDETLRALFASGEINQIYEKWFTRTIEGKNINLNTPMSGKLKRALRAPTDSSDPARYM